MEESRKDQDKKQKESGYKAVKSLMSFLIENYVRSEPYITVVSKKQLWWGNGKFLQSEHPKGLIHALNLKSPSQKKKDEAREFYGYNVMRSPYELINGIINATMKKTIINQQVEGGNYDDIRVIQGMGYVRENGTLDPNQTKGISCYVLFAADLRLRENQNEWIKAQPQWVRLQITRNMQTHKKHLANQLKSAMNKQNIIEKLLALNEYKELDTGISRDDIPWEMDE